MRTLAFAAIMTCLLAMGVNTMGRDCHNPPLEIKGTKVSTEVDARRIASDAHIKKISATSKEFRADEGVRVVAVVTLGHDVPGFAAKGERIWEARALTMIDGRLRAIIWINPRSEAVRFLYGPWEATEVGPDQQKK